MELEIIFYFDIIVFMTYVRSKKDFEVLFISKFTNKKMYV